LNFIQKMKMSIASRKSFLCVGLDPDPRLMPPGISLDEFILGIVKSTSDLACSYKINFAFFESMGEKGFAHLKFARDCVPEDIPVIADAKRADIGNTSRQYAEAIFSVMGFDAITVNPYMGHDSLLPFISYTDRGVFILCRTSNPGSSDFQDVLVSNGTDKIPLYQLVSKKAAEWNQNGNIGLVVGATWPEEIKQIRNQNPDMPLLIPGVGAQGGSIELVAQNAIGPNSKMAIINSSRSIIHASCENDFGIRARLKAEEMRNQINFFSSR